MPQSISSLDSLLITIVLATLALGLPILLVLSFRFLWDRSLHLGRSKELEKLIWQLHRNRDDSRGHSRSRLRPLRARQPT